MARLRCQAAHAWHHARLPAAPILFLAVILAVVGAAAQESHGPGGHERRDTAGAGVNTGAATAATAARILSPDCPLLGSVYVQRVGSGPLSIPGMASYHFDRSGRARVRIPMHAWLAWIIGVFYRRRS